MPKRFLKAQSEHNKKFGEEFKKFISRGNVVELAIAIVIGAAFNKIVSQFVESFITPFVSIFVGKTHMSDWKYVITPASVAEDGTELAEVAITYGVFLSVVMDFIVTALCVFVMFKVYKYIKKRMDAEREKLRAEIFKKTVEQERAAAEEAKRKADEEAAKLKAAEEAAEAERLEEKERRRHEEQLLAEICELLKSKSDNQ